MGIHSPISKETMSKLTAEHMGLNMLRSICVYSCLMVCKPCNFFRQVRRSGFMVTGLSFKKSCQYEVLLYLLLAVFC